MRETLAACRRLNQIRNYTSTSPLDEMRTTFRMGPMSETGPNRKSSMRANVFRFAPESGHCATESACPFRAMCGRLRVGKDFLHVLQHWSVQPCVRPFNAVHMTAGHNALRGSGPDQTLAFDNAM